MTIDLAPERMSPKYAPSITAEQFGRQLAQLLEAIGERFAAVRPDAIAALEAGDVMPAEQLCSDEEYIADMASEVVRRFAPSGFLGVDGVVPMLMDLTGINELEELLEETPERTARRRAWNVARGIDPDTDEVIDAARFESYLSGDR